MAQRQAKEIDRLQIIVDRFGAQATKAAMAHSIEKRIARMSANAAEAPKGQRSVHVRFPPPPAPGRTAIVEIGRATCRDRVCQSGTISVVDVSSKTIR